MARTEERTPLSRLIAACVVTALLGCLVSQFALTTRAVRSEVRHVGEPPGVTSPAGAPAASSDAAHRQAEKSGINVDKVVASVSDRLTADPNRPGSFFVRDDHAVTAFDAAGLHVTPVGSSRGLDLTVTGIGRGTVASTVRPGAWRVDANVASRVLRDGAIERTTVSPGSVEWDVVLGRRPAGSGPLRIDAHVGGISAAEVSHRGDRPSLRLTLRDGRQIQMAEVVVVDARGSEVFRALPVVRGSRLHMDVPASALAAARYPLTIDPTVSVNHPVGTVPAPADQNTPAIAWNGTNFLIVWYDARTVGNEVYAARLNSAGALLDPTGIPIGTGHGVTGKPAVASDGNGFLVVWEDPRNGAGQSTNIYGARVNGAGELLDPVGFAVSGTTGSQFTPALAWNGANYLVAWSSGNNIFGSRVTSSGTVIAPIAIPISTSIPTVPVAKTNPAVAAQGSVFYLAWEDMRNGGNSYDIYGTRVNGAGVVQDSVGVAISTASANETNPSIASNGTNLLVAWNADDGPVLQIRATRLNSAGAVLDAGGIPISPSGSFALDLSVARSGTGFLVAWGEFRLDTSTFDIRGNRITNAGAALDPDGFTISAAANGQTEPALAWNGTNNLAAWQDTRNGSTGNDIYGTRVSPTATVLDPAGTAISTSLTSDAEWSPALAWNGTNFLAVWEDGRSGMTEDVYAARLDANGNLLDPAGILLSTAPDFQGVPSVAWNGTNFLVVWEDFRNGSNYDIYGTRVAPSGAVLDPLGLPISPAAGDQFSPRVAWNGTNFLVVWEDYRNGSNSDIYGTRVNAAGMVLDVTGIAISQAAGLQTRPTVTSNGSDFFTAWTDARNATSDIYGARINSAGTVLNSNGIPISTVTGDQTNPAAAWNGSHYFVAWTDLRSGADDIYGARLNSSGGLLDGSGIVVSGVSGDQDQPTIAASGSVFLVAWRDTRSGFYDVYATRVSDAASVEDASGFVVSAVGLAGTTPAASSGPGGGWAVAHVQLQGVGQGIDLHTISPK